MALPGSMHTSDSLASGAGRGGSAAGLYGSLQLHGRELFVSGNEDDKDNGHVEDLADFGSRTERDGNGGQPGRQGIRGGRHGIELGERKRRNVEGKKSLEKERVAF